MTNKNTRSKGEYALDHILWGLISWLWFTKSLFRNIEGLSYDRSRLVLLGTLEENIDVVYRRFHEQGRMMPDGVRYVDSWVTADSSTCCQINESRSEALLHEWAANRSDVTDFEFIPVISSREMREKMAQEA